MEKNGRPTMDQMDANLKASDNIRDCKLVNNDLEKNLFGTDLTVQSECSEAAVGSIKNLSEANAGSKKKKNKKKKKKKVLDEIQNVDQPKMETGPMENLAIKNNGPRTIDQMDGNLEASENIGDCRLVNNDLEKNCLETYLTVQSLAECPEAAAGSKEYLSELNAGSKKKKIQELKKAKIPDEIQNVDHAKMDTGSIENLAGENVNGKRKRRGRKKKAKNRDESQSMDQVDGMSNLHLSDGNHGKGIQGKLIEKECIGEESGISIRKESSLSDVVHGGENPLDVCKDEGAEGSVRNESSLSDIMHSKENLPDLCKDEITEVSARKESSLSDSMHDKENSLDLSKNKETVLLSDVVEVSTIQVSSDVVEERSEHVLSPMEVDVSFIPCQNPLSSHPNQMVVENAKLESGFNEVNNEIVVNEGQCRAEDRSMVSTCNAEVTLHHSSTVVKEVEWLLKDLGQFPQIGLVPSIKRKLIVLDVNGLLAHIVMPAPKDCRGDVHILGRAIFKRPFCDDFLKFCFQNFDVGVWSSRSKKIIDRVVDYLLGDLRAKLLFCWDMSHSTQTGFNTLENVHKPLVCKELRKIWENDDPNLPWKKGDYNESNTLLLDDSPYKALLNPLHTAIFPNSYHYEDKNDNSLGPGGDLRVYLEGLLTSENVKKYVEQHPFGQGAINETNLSWDFYVGVLQTMSNGLQDNTPSSLPTFS